MRFSGSIRTSRRRRTERREDESNGALVLAWATRKKNANKNYGHNSTMRKE